MKPTIKKMKDKIIKIFEDWNIENPENLITWLEPIIQRYGEQKEKEGRTQVYCNLEKMKDNFSMFPLK